MFFTTQLNKQAQNTEIKHLPIQHDLHPINNTTNIISNSTPQTNPTY